MNQRVRLFFRNLFYAVGANLSRILTTFGLTLLLPKFLSVESYGYWQLYGFYNSYLGYSSLGRSEGVLIKYAGERYEDLDGRTLSSQFWTLAVQELLFIAAAVILGNAWMKDPVKLFVLKLSLTYIFVQILKHLLLMILQATNRISEYAKCYTGERVLFFVLSLCCLFLGFRDFWVFACAEIVSVTAVLIWAAVLCREVTFRRPLPLRQSLPLTLELIRIGSKIMIAELAGVLVIGIVRLAIEEHWGIEVFGEISLSLSMAHMLITCISAVAVVLFPMLRRTNQKRLFELYLPARTCLTAAMYGLLLFYIPGKKILELWLPQYRDSLRYLAILFPLCIYETRTSTLAYTYLKTLRREKDILKANVICVGASLVMTFLTVRIFQNLDLAVFSILALYALKAMITEGYLSRQMSLRLGWAHLSEGLLAVLFIFCNWSLPDGAAFLGYLCAYAVFLAVRGKEILRCAGILKRLSAEGGDRE